MNFLEVFFNLCWFQDLSKPGVFKKKTEKSTTTARRVADRLFGWSFPQVKFHHTKWLQRPRQPHLVDPNATRHQPTSGSDPPPWTQPDSCWDVFLGSGSKQMGRSTKSCQRIWCQSAPNDGTEIQHPRFSIPETSLEFRPKIT